MYFHQKKREELHKLINPAYLPKDYGGDLPKINYTGKDWFPSVKNHEEFIKKWNDYGFSSSA